MKKITLFLIPFLFVPLIVNAAWWNPFSWFGFSLVKTSTIKSTQENQLKEDGLDIKKATTSEGVSLKMITGTAKKESNNITNSDNVSKSIISTEERPQNISKQTVSSKVTEEIKVIESGTSEEKVLFNSYLFKRIKIRNDLLDVSDTVSNSKVDNHLMVINEQFSKLETISSEISSMVIPTLPFSEKLIDDKNHLKKIKEKMYSYALYKKSMLNTNSLNSFYEYKEKADDNFQEMLDIWSENDANFEKIKFEANKYFDTSIY